MLRLPLLLVVGLVLLVAGLYFPDPTSGYGSINALPARALERVMHPTATRMAARAGPYQTPTSREGRLGFPGQCGTYLARSRVELRHAASRAHASHLGRYDRVGPVPTHPAGVVALIRPLDGRPYGVAVAPNGTTYVALIGTNSLLRGSLASQDFTAPVNVGSTPPHVVMNRVGTRAYATLQTGRGIAVVDVAANTLLATVPLTSDGFNLAVKGTGDLVYATTAAGTLHVLDAATHAVVETLNVGPAANGLTFSPDECTLYVTSRDAGTVTAVSTISHTITRIYHVGGMPQRIAMAPDGSEIYVANERSGLNVVNLENGATTSVSFGTAGYGLGLTPDGEQLYVLLPAAGEVRILNRATLAPIKSVFVGGTPRNVTFDLLGTTAMVTTEEAVVFIQ
jgi:YVTN family beta-propeller protein